MSDDERPSEGPLGFEDAGPARPGEVPPDDHELPDPDAPRSYQPRGLPISTSKYTWFVGVVAVILLAVVTVNTLTSKHPGSRGVALGSIIPPFAAPLAGGQLNGDVNTAKKADSGSAGKVAACSIHRSDVLTSCELYAKRPLVLAFFATRGGQCISELDTIARVSSVYPGVAFAAIAIRGDRGDLRKMIAGHGWRFPIGYDRDGVLANLFSVAVCPQITFVRRGGRSAGTTLGKLSEPQLRTRIAALEAGRRVPR